MAEKVFTYGVVVFADNLSPRTLDEVRRAADSAGIDEEVRSIKPRNTFIRAIRQLQKENIIERGESGTLCDKFADDDIISFQFSQRFVEEQGVSYNKFAVVTFNKESNVIACPDQGIRQIAHRLYDSIQNVYQPYDLNALAKRVTEKHGARRIMMRDGVYFIPLSHIAVAEKLKKFFTSLNFSFIVLPVSSESAEKQSVVRCVVRDIAQSIKGLATEVETLKASGDLTPRVARRRLEDLEESLEQYKGLAHDLRADLKEMIQEAGDSANALYNFGVDSVDEMIAGIQQGRLAGSTGVRIVPLVHDLLTVAAEMEPICIPAPQPVAVEADAD